MIRNVRYKNRKQNLEEEDSSKDAGSEKKNYHWDNDINTDVNKSRYSKLLNGDLEFRMEYFRISRRIMATLECAEIDWVEQLK
jgi:hypothetical protein